MRVIMTGGGTGGHIYPAIAIADKIREENPDSPVLFVGTERGLESKIVPDHGYPIRFIRVRGFNRKNLSKNFNVIKDLIKGLSQAKKIMKEFKPDLVVGTGGYVCAPVVFVAQRLGIPTYIHEQNAYPGLTNKLLEGGVKKIFLGFPEAEPYFKHKEKVVVTGNPVRKDFFNLDRNQCREHLGIPGSDFMILASGGSGGAGRLNKELLNVVKYFDGTLDVSIFFATGRVYYKSIKEEIATMDIRNPEKVHVLEYIEDMHHYMGAADLVIGRAGALTVAEITTSGRASILIPSPNVTGNHQFFNARAVSENGGAILLEEKNLSEEALCQEIQKLLNNKSALKKMEAASKECGHANATETIYTSMTCNLK